MGMAKGIIDNKQTGLVGNMFKESISQGSKISIAAAYFTLYAFVELKKELAQIEEFWFVFTEPAFVEDQDLISDLIEKNETLLYGIDEEQRFKVDLTQGYVAKELAKWLEKKAQIKSVTKQRIQGRLYHIANKDGKQMGQVGGAPFSSSGLGLYINMRLFNVKWSRC